MSVSMRVIEPGLLTTVQDLGRPGMGTIGVPVGGAADAVSLLVANRAVGNAEGAAGLEMTLTGAGLEFDGPAIVAFAGAECDAEVVAKGGARRGIAGCVSECVGPGEIVRVGRVRGGARVYLAVAGGVEVETVLGSTSTLVSGGFGGKAGRALRRGDVLRVGPARAGEVTRLAGGVIAVVRGVCERRVLRAVGGPHADRLSAEAIEAFWRGPFTVTGQSDRVGLRLDGPVARARTEGRLRSEGMMHGAVEVPESGKPIVLMCEHPTTGGYPVIACVAAVDLPTLGQLIPGDSLRFERVTQRDALELLRKRERVLGEGSTGP